MTKNEKEKEEAKQVAAEEQGADSSLAKVGEQKVTGKGDDIRKRILELTENIHGAYWELSKLLYEVGKNHLYREWGFQTFEEYVEKDMIFGVRKARYLQKIQSWLLALPEELQEEIRESEVGWAKIKDIAGVEDHSKIRDLVAKAKETSVGDFTDYARGVKNESEGGGGGGEEESTHRITFIVPHSEYQNIEDAIKSGQDITSKGRSEALALICADFASGQTIQKGEKIDVKHYLKKVEKLVGLKIVAIDDKDRSIVYGQRTIDKIMKDEIKEDDKPNGKEKSK